MSLYGYLYKNNEEKVDLNDPAENKDIILKIPPYGNLQNLDIELPSNLINNLVKIEATFNKIKILSLLTPFINLKELYVNSNKLDTLPDLPRHLEILNCSLNNLTYLPDLQSLNNLKYLNIYGNKLTKLRELPPNLTELICNDNNIEQLPELPSKLTLLACRYNPTLKSLPELPKNLTALNCDNCQLTTLPILSTTQLKSLICNNNKLTALPQLPDTIAHLSCNDNDIKTIEENLPESLENIKFDGNTNLNYDALIKIIKCYRNIARKLGHMRCNIFGMDIQMSRYMLRAKKMEEDGMVIDLSLRRQLIGDEESTINLSLCENPPPRQQPLPDIARNNILGYFNARTILQGNEIGGKRKTRKTKNRKNKKLHRKTKTNKRSKTKTKTKTKTKK